MWSGQFYWDEVYVLSFDGIPAADPVFDYLENPEIILEENFSTITAGRWMNLPLGYEQLEGALYFDPQNEALANNPPHIILSQRMESRNAVWTRFKYEGSLKFGLSMEGSILENKVTLAVIRDEATGSFMLDMEHATLGRLMLPLEGDISTPQPGVWYDVLLATDGQGTALGAVWESSNPDRRSIQVSYPGPEFTAQDWKIWYKLW